MLANGRRYRRSVFTLLELGEADIPVGLQQAKTISFTFFWPNGDGEAYGEKGRWEQHNYTVEVAPGKMSIGKPLKLELNRMIRV